MVCRSVSLLSSQQIVPVFLRGSRAITRVRTKSSEPQECIITVSILRRLNGASTLHSAGSLELQQGTSAKVDGSNLAHFLFPK
jgi:hypothetical protein